MLTKEENELLTRIGPRTPAGGFCADTGTPSPSPLTWAPSSPPGWFESSARTITSKREDPAVSIG